MQSRLFHAIVVAGVALGASLSGCSSVVAEGLGDSSAAAVDVANATDAAAPDTSAVPDASRDVTVDVVAPRDVRPIATDARPDIVADAFCDNTWPTTKGNMGPPACVDPTGACAAAEPGRCAMAVSSNSCTGPLFATRCVNGAWQCDPGQILTAMCRCWLPLQPGFVCTPNGPVRIDAGTTTTDASVEMLDGSPGD